MHNILACHFTAESELKPQQQTRQSANQKQGWLSSTSSSAAIAAGAGMRAMDLTTKINSQSCLLYHLHLLIYPSVHGSATTAVWQPAGSCHWQHKVLGIHHWSMTVCRRERFIRLLTVLLQCGESTCAVCAVLYIAAWMCEVDRKGSWFRFRVFGSSLFGTHWELQKLGHPVEPTSGAFLSLLSLSLAAGLALKGAGAF